MKINSTILFVSSIGLMSILGLFSSNAFAQDTETLDTAVVQNEGAEASIVASEALENTDIIATEDLAASSDSMPTESSNDDSQPEAQSAETPNMPAESANDDSQPEAQSAEAPSMPAESANDDSQPEAQDEDVVNYDSVHDRSGLEISGGVGFGGPLALGFGGHIAVSYDIIRNFALGIEFAGNWSLQPGIIVSVVPKLLFPYERFRLTIGLGLGWDRFTPTSLSGGKYNSVNSFALKPELQFDWFINSNFFIGFGVDWVGKLGANCGEEANYTIDAYLHLGLKY